jgi:DNA recombination protein RmuC
MNSLLIIIIGLLLVAIVLIYVFRNKNSTDLPQLLTKLTELQSVLAKIESNVKEDFRQNREEMASIAKSNREELNQAITTFRGETTDKIQQLNNQSVAVLEKVNTTLEQKVSALIDKTEKSSKEFEASFEKNVKAFNDLQRDKFAQLENKQNELVQGTEKKLESIRVTVEEKLEKTLSERLGQSFETVGKQLIEVQKGLGEMQTLAQDVGGLKKVLSNVKMRGGIGEVQLSLLLDQLLAPDQYQANVKTKKGEDSIVEFAIKLPGRDAALEQVWLPIDAKFPKDKYEQLQEAYDAGDATLIQQAQKTLEDAIKSMAKDICQKYLNPPATTDFGIMFLPFEGIYAEVVRKASLLEEIQRDYKVIITGPSTLAAILNSLQMGFRTLAIQKRSSEVWQVLGAVKKEFENFGGMLSKAQNNIQTGLNQLDDVMGVRTRAINRRLKSVTALPEAETKFILPDITDQDLQDEETEN